MESPTAASKSQQVLSNSTLSEVLDDLCVRFIVFLPEEEKKSVERICFQIEEAHWFYEDFVRELNPGLPNINLRSFIHQIFNHIPQSIIAHIPQGKTENAFTDFMVYKKRVPVRGAIMLNLAMNKCVLVKGWKSGSSWSFPRGKIDQDEDDRDCAIREALEETGYDLKGMVGPDDFIELPMRDQNVKLYIAPGVPDDAEFAPQTRNEISKIEWHKLSELPGYSAKRGAKGQDQLRSGKYYMVAPFMREIKRWISTTGKKWLVEQQQAAAEQQHEVSVAASNFNLASEETEQETESEQVKTSEDSVAGLRSLLGIEKAAEVVEHGQMTSTEQEEASRRLKEMLGGGPSAPPPAENMANGNPNQASMPSPPKNMLSYDNLAPNAKALLGILQSGENQPPAQANHQLPHSQPPPPHIPHPQDQQFIPHSGPEQYPPFGPQHQPPPHYGMAINHGPPPQHLPYGGFPHQPPHPHQHQQHMQYPPQHQPTVTQGYQTSPARAGNGWQQGPGTPRHAMTPGGYLPSPPPTSRFGPPHPPPGINQQPPKYPNMHQQGPMHPNPHVGGQKPPPPPGLQQPAQNSYKGAFHQQIPPTPVDNFAPPPPVPTKPPDPTQAGALLSILTGAAPAVTQAENIPPTSQQQQPATGISLQPAPPPRKLPLQQQRPHQQPRASSSAPRDNSAHTPPPQRPGATQAPTTPSLRQKTPTVIDHYGAQKTVSPIPSASFDRRTSVAGEQAKTLLAMFRNDSAGQKASESVVHSPETPKKPLQNPQIERLSTPSGKSVRPKDRENLLAYLEDVAKGY